MIIPHFNQRPTQLGYYKVVDSRGDMIVGYAGFPLSFVERKHPHQKIIKITSTHLYSGMDKNHRNK